MNKSVGRDGALDRFKTALIVGLVWGHIYELLKIEETPVENWPLRLFWVVGFSGFLFAFGWGAQIAYFSKPRQLARKKLFTSFITLLAAYFVSGFSWHLIFENHSFRQLAEIVAFRHITSYSEFLLSWAVMMLLVYVFFGLIIKITDSRRNLIIAIVMSGLTTFIPAEWIQIPILGTVLGTNHFYCFPILPYSMFFFLGVWYYKNGSVIPRWLWAISVPMFLAGAVYYINEGYLPRRFPPSLLFLLSGWLPVLVYLQISRKLKFESKVVRVCGRHTLLFVLVSSLTIFILKSLFGEFTTPLTTLLLSILIFGLCFGISLLSDYVKNFSRRNKVNILGRQKGISGFPGV